MQYDNANLTTLVNDFDAFSWLGLGITAICALIFALYGFKLLRIAVILSGVTIGFSIGYVQIPLILGDLIGSDSLPLIIGLLSATVLGLMAISLYKFVIFVSAFYTSFILGAAFATSFVYNITDLPISKDLLVIIVATLVAIILAYLICKFFKPLYIVYCSVGGMLTFVITLALPFELIKAGLFNTLASVLGIAGITLGVFAAIRQFKRCSNISF